MEKELIAKNYTININDLSSISKYLDTNTYSKIFILVDDNTEKYCLHKIIGYLPENVQIIRVASGEINKNLNTCQKIWKKLINNGADRYSLLINLGGGVVCDMGGFCAATYMRGIDFIQIPTTLLSMADASIGGKLGIDFNAYKNIVGLISDPEAVFVITDFLETLPYDQLRSGYAELLKHGLISDQKVWKQLSVESDIVSLDYNSIITKSISIKKNITEQDPNEKGLRKILNFGHTIGHALESYWLESSTPLLHGEAIAIGMVAEAYISYSLGKISEEDLFEIRKSIINLYGHKRKYVKPIEKIISYLKSDKKNYGDNINMSLLDGIGSSYYDEKVTPKMIYQSLFFYREKM